MTYALSTLIIFGAFFGQAIFGFGGGLLSVPLLSVILSVQDAICTSLIFQLLTGLILLKSWDQIPWQTIRPLGLGLFVGTIVGILMLAYTPDFYLRLLLLAFILLFLIRSRVFKERRFPGIQRPIWATTTGVMAGFVQGILGTGGPVVIIYLNETVEDQGQFRSAAIITLFGCNVLRLFIAAPTGLLSAPVAKVSLIALPTFLIALALGQRLHHVVPAETYRGGVELLMVIAAITLGVKLIA